MRSAPKLSETSCAITPVCSWVVVETRRMRLPMRLIGMTASGSTTIAKRDRNQSSQTIAAKTETSVSASRTRFVVARVSASRM